jgi:hypothetical protein
VMSVLPPKADIANHCWDVCFVLIADILYSSLLSAEEIAIEAEERGIAFLNGQ